MTWACFDGHSWLICRNIPTEPSVSYRSFKFCLIITESLPGLRRNMILRQSSRIFAQGSEELGGRDG
jgi:hypothetical protein